MSDRDTADAVRPWRVLMVGGGRPDRLDGIELRFRELADEMPETNGVVAGTNEEPASERIRAIGAPDWPLPLRLLEFTRAIRAESRTADIIDIHSALHAFLPLTLGVFRHKEIVAHLDVQRRDTRGRGPGALALARWLRTAFERHVYRRATIVITPTGASKRILVEDFGLPPWRVRVLTTGVDAAWGAEGDRDEARTALSIGSDVFVACCLRPLVSRQGVRILLDAWSQLVAERASGPTASRMLLIGGQDETADSLEGELRASGMSDSVRVLREVTEERLGDLFRAADVQVIPSRPAAGRGRTVLEAAICGTPSIVALAAGLSDVLSELDETLLVSANDPSALARRLEGALDGALPSRTSTRTWAKRHRLDLATQHRAIYDRLLDPALRPPKKLRVAYIGHVAQLSGGEIALTRLIDALPEVEAHVILAEDGPLVARLLASGVSVEVLPLRERTRRLRKDRVGWRVPLAALADTAVYTLRLARRLRAIRPDVVHTNTLKAGIYGSVAARLTGIPSVWHVRDRIAPDYLPRAAVVLLRRLTSLIPDGVIANSESTRSTLRSPPERTLVMHSIVHDPVSAPRASVTVPRRRTLVVGMVGRLAPWKGQHVFLEAFAQAFRDCDARAIIVGSPMFGDAETRYAAGLHELVAALGIVERVEFRGFRHDVWSELADIDVFVHASITPEPFGQVIVEAMLAGVPVIAAAGGGPSEIVTDGVDGLLYPPGDVDQLGAAMVRLARDAELRERLSTNGRLRAAAFSPEETAAGAMSMYAGVLESRRSVHTLS